MFVTWMLVQTRGKKRYRQRYRCRDYNCDRTWQGTHGHTALCFAKRVHAEDKRLKDWLDCCDWDLRYYGRTLSEP